MKTRIPKPPKHIDGLTKLATAIADHFKISCTKQLLMGWQKRSQDPFPVAAISGSNRYDRASCFDWIERYLKAAGSGDRAFDELLQKSHRAEAEAKIRKNEREAFEFDKDKGKYIPRTTADTTVKGVLIQYHGFVRSEIEQITPIERKNKLQELGVSQEIISKFHEFDLQRSQTTVDRIAARCQQQAREYEELSNKEAAKAAGHNG